MISENIFVKIPFKTGNKKARIVNINKVKQSWNLSYTSVVDVRLERFPKVSTHSQAVILCVLLQGLWKTKVIRNI